MGRRYKVPRAPGAYVERDRRGRFKKWTKVHRSIRADSRRKVRQRRSEPGYGHVQDYNR